MSLALRGKYFIKKYMKFITSVLSLVKKKILRNMLQGFIPFFVVKNWTILS